MKTPQEKELLLERIIALEYKQSRDLQLLKKQFHLTMEDLNPLTMVKKTIFNAFTSPDTRLDLLHTAATVTKNYLSKNTVLGLFQKPIKRLLGNMALSVLTKLSPTKAKTL